MAAPVLLNVEAMAAYYGDSQTLFDISLAVAPGEVVALVGRNGAGKTTIFRALMGFPAPRVTVQTVDYQGQSLKGMATHLRVRAGLGYVPEDRRIFAGLTVAENLAVATSARGHAEHWDLVHEIFPILTDLAQRRGDWLSGGQQQMLTIARTLLTGPSLILLDEPTEGLAPIVVEELLEKLKRLKDAGISMVIAEQNLKFTRQLCDRAYVLESGAVRYHGTLAELDRDTDQWQHYLSI